MEEQPCAKTEITENREAWWKLKNTQLDTFTKFFTMMGVVGAITGAFIAYKNYSNQTEEDDLNQSVLDFHVSAKISKVFDEQSLVLVTVDLNNKGKRTIHPYAHTDDAAGVRHYQGEGLTLSVTRHPLPKGDVAVPNDGDDDERVVQRYNILEKYDYSRNGSWDRNFAIKPNTEYREMEAFTLKRHALYEIRARFHAFRRNADESPVTFSNTETIFIYAD